MDICAKVELSRIRKRSPPLGNARFQFSNEAQLLSSIHQYQSISTQISIMERREKTKSTSSNKNSVELQVLKHPNETRSRYILPSLSAYWPCKNTRHEVQPQEEKVQWLPSRKLLDNSVGDPNPLKKLLSSPQLCMYKEKKLLRIHHCWTHCYARMKKKFSLSFEDLYFLF